MNLNILDKKNKLKKNPKTHNYLNRFGETSMFIDGITESLQKDYEGKIYNNTEGNLISVKNVDKRKNHNRFNLNNYEKIFNKNKEKNFFTFKEEANAEIIKNIFDLFKMRLVKNETMNNKTAFTNQNKNILTRYLNAFTNPNGMRIIPDKIRNKTNSITSDLSYEHNSFKNRTIIPGELVLSHKKQNSMTISKNKTKYPDLTSLKNKINNLDKSAKKINYNFIAKINSRNKNFNINKKKVNISLIKQKKNDKTNYYEDENNKHFIKNKKYFNNYIKKLSTFKYNNDLINKFLEKKDEERANYITYFPKVKRKIEENDQYYYLHEKAKIKQIPVLNKFNNLIKEKFKSQVDKEIFNIFNKKL
jgi:hypothetical protein